MLEIIAYTTMIIDHIGYCYYPDIYLFRIIGRIALPIFLYLVGNGVEKTSNIKKYLIRILLTACISQPIYILLFHNDTLNICFTLFTCSCILSLYKLEFIRFELKIMMVLIIFSTYYVFNFEYGIYALILSIIYFINSSKNINLFILHLFVTSTFIYLHLVNYIQIYSIIGIILIIFIKKIT